MDTFNIMFVLFLWRKQKSLYVSIQSSVNINICKALLFQREPPNVEYSWGVKGRQNLLRKPLFISYLFKTKFIFDWLNMIIIIRMFLSIKSILIYLF